MTRSFVFLSCLVAFFLCPGCRSSELTLDEKGELTGRIYVLGNDPFTRVALELDEEKHVVLLCSPDVERYLRTEQGRQARIQYDGTSKVPEGQAVQVTSAKIVTE